MREISYANIVHFVPFFFNNVKRSTKLKAYVCSVHERKCIRNCKTCGSEKNINAKIIGWTCFMIIITVFDKSLIKTKLQTSDAML